jgi:hypothetical protein
MTPDPLLRQALACTRPHDDPPADLLPRLLRHVPPPLTLRERREPWLWALAPLAGGALLLLWASGRIDLAVPDLSWLPPLLVAAALHAAGPSLFARLLPKD